MGIGAVVGEGAAGPLVAFANGATANNVQQPSKTLILRKKTRSGRPTPSLWIVAVPVDEPRAISAAANKAKKKGSANCRYFWRITQSRRTARYDARGLTTAMRSKSRKTGILHRIALHAFLSADYN